jgi:hypothetical protein
MAADRSRRATSPEREHDANLGDDARKLLEFLPASNAVIASVIYLVETGLRELTIELMERVRGPRWVRSAIPGGDLQERIRNAREYERKTPWSSFVPLHPIYYLDFPDITRIIEKSDNWDAAFKPVFQRKDIVTSLLRRLEPLRNKAAHNRRATTSDARQAISTLDAIDGMLVAAAGTASLRTYAQRCTSAPDLSERFGTLHAELSTALAAMQATAPPIPLPAWESTCNEWWFDSDYLGVSLDAVQGTFDVLCEYAQLPRSRGNGHVIESWVRARDTTPDASKALQVLSTLSNVSNE